MHSMDIMDGHFVPNLALNLNILKQIRSIANIPIDVHLMVENPKAILEPAIEAGADPLYFPRSNPSPCAPAVDNPLGRRRSGNAMNRQRPSNPSDCSCRTSRMVMVMTGNRVCGTEAD